MTTMAKVKARWSGFTGSPGYSNFYFREWTDGTHVVTAEEATAAVAKVRAFFDLMKTGLPPVVSIQVDPEVEVVEDTTNTIQGVVAATPVAVVTGTASAPSYAAAVGAVFTWHTNGVRNGRRVRGRTFIVPMASSVFDTNGTINSGWMTNLGLCGSNMIADDAATPTFGVYSRPSGPGATDGSWTVATGFRVPDMSAVLRSRRD
jgi:hypothetical protein